MIGHKEGATRCRQTLHKVLAHRVVCLLTSLKLLDATFFLTEDPQHYELLMDQSLFHLASCRINIAFH